MDELTRFARRLVEQLGAGSEGVHRPVQVTALRETVLPYRTHRRALGIDSVEDYETVLLRLVAGERGYVRTVPAEAAERCRTELAHATPDLGVLDEVGEATVQITSMAAAQIVGDNGEHGEDGEVSADRDARAVPSAPAVPAPPSAPSIPSSSSPPAPLSCRHCRHGLPSGRQVVFCPWCGERLVPFTCPRCDTELDSEWRHCITCGAEVKDPFRYG